MLLLIGGTLIFASDIPHLQPTTESPVADSRNRFHIMVVDIKEGLDALRASRGLMLAFGQVSIAVLVLFMLFALAPAYVSKVLLINAQDTYVILAPATGGAILSALLLGQFLRNLDRAKVLAGSLVANGVTLLALAAVPEAMAQFPALQVHNRITSAAFSFLLGVEFGAIMIPAITYLMESTSDEIRGRIFALLYMVINGVTAVPVLVAAALSDTIGTAHVIGASRPGGASPSHDNHRHQQHDHNQTTKTNRSNDRFEQRKVAPQQITGEADDCGPGEAAQRAEELEAPEGHARHACQDRTPGAQTQHETRREDRPVAVAGKEQLGAGDVLRADAEDAAESFDERPSALEPKEVADIGAGCRPEETEKDDENDRVVPGRCPSRGGQQQDLAGKRNAGAFDEDAKPRRRITKRIDDRSRIHREFPSPERGMVRVEGDSSVYRASIY